MTTDCSIFYFSGALSSDFEYPEGFKRAMESGVEVSPWWFVFKNPEFANLCYSTINKKLPEGYLLVPFAKNDNSDSIACFDGRKGQGEPKIFTYKGEKSFDGEDMEARFRVSSFDHWLSIFKRQ